MTGRGKPLPNGRARFGAISILAAGLAGCASQAQIEAKGIERSQQWGDRTLAITYRFSGPVIAYYEPGVGNGGRVLIWNEGRPDLAVGRWYIKDAARLCVTPNPYYKEMTFNAPFEREDCYDLSDGPLDVRHYKGDVFALSGRSAAPYVSSQADNPRIRQVLDTASEYRRTPFGNAEEAQPPRKPVAPAGDITSTSAVVPAGSE